MADPKTRSERSRNYRSMSSSILPEKETDPIWTGSRLIADSASESASRDRLVDCTTTLVGQLDGDTLPTRANAEKDKSTLGAPVPHVIGHDSGNHDEARMQDHSESSRTDTSPPYVLSQKADQSTEDNSFDSTEIISVNNFRYLSATNNSFAEKREAMDASVQKLNLGRSLYNVVTDHQQYSPSVKNPDRNRNESKEGSPTVLQDRHQKGCKAIKRLYKTTEGRWSEYADPEVERRKQERLNQKY